jgi:hypothetical protein
MQELVRESIIAATGHRPTKLGGYGRPVQARLEAFAGAYPPRPAGQNDLRHGVGPGYRIRKANLDLDIPFIAAVPFAGQESMWPPEGQREYNNLLARAITVHVVTPGGYSAAKMQARNEWMVDHCTRVAALWDGSDLSS